MTRLTAEYAQYASRVYDALADEKTRGVLLGRYAWLGALCLDCDREVELAGDAQHLVFHAPGNSLYVVVGCEGYWHVNPGEVGIIRGAWSPPEDFLEVPGEDAECSCTSSALGWRGHRRWCAWRRHVEATITIEEIDADMLRGAIG